MEKIKIQYTVFMLFIWAVSSFFFQSCKKPQIFLQEDLSIGVNEGDENLIFGGISSICFDAEECIYVLDWKMWRVQKFDSQGIFLKSFIIQRGQGPEELTFPGEMAVSPQGKIFLYDFMDWKILVLDKEGNAINSFKLDFNVISIKSSGDETITVMGDKDKKLLHIYDIEGKIASSFGAHFEVPQNLTSYEYPTVKYPQGFTVSESGRIYVCDPHNYEISVYWNEKLERKIKGNNTAFWPVAVKDGREVTITGVSVFESKDRIYSFILSHGEVPNQLDIFEKNKQVESLDISGFVKGIDARGRLYLYTEEPFLRIVRYEVKF